MAKANPTQKTQQEIFRVIQKSEAPMTLTAIAESSRKGLYAVQETIKFLEHVGLIKTLVTSGNTTIVMLNKNPINNATTTN